MLPRTIGLKWLGVGVLACVAAGAGAATPNSAAPPITKLKDLHLPTPIVTDGRARATIVVPASGRYDAIAARIAQAAKDATGIALPVAKDDSPAAAGVPLAGHTIVLGNRSTNRLIAALYDRLYTMLDLRYPGPGGYVVRTLHNPFGNGGNAVLVGGSDDAGVSAAADVLVGVLKAAAAGKSIHLGRLADIRLGPGIRVPKDIRQAGIWEASDGYGSTGYFGWNSLSKRMALYYMTGDAFHAREFLRLAFPDAQARKEIADIDGERIEDKDHPLGGPYHYNAHMMICLWDLIEESPAFTDDDRLRVTRAFAGQLDHLAAEWTFPADSAQPPAAVGSRHHQWAAVSLYCLARYFQTYYPSVVWQRCLAGAVRHFSPLHSHAWVSGENDNLFWYNTAIAPILTYMVLTGDRVPLDSGVLATLLRGQEILASGRSPDWALNSASLGFLHKAAYLTGDGRWLTYRGRTRVDTGDFRLGQSFWPDEGLTPRPPEDLVGKWSIYRLPEPKWRARHSGLKLAESFEFGSFRSRPDAGGDFILIDGFNGASRNPYHAFAILELRLAGYTLLRDYLNQVITRVDGLVEPKIAMDAALKGCGAVGQAAWAVGEVPDAAFANWRRTLAQRVGRYALVVDELTFRADSPSADVQIEWQTDHGGKALDAGRVAFAAAKEYGGRRTDAGATISACDPLATTGGGTRWTMHWQGPVHKGGRRTFFSLVGMQPGMAKPTLECHRIAADSAALALPEPAMAVAHGEGKLRAELAVLAADHLFARGATRIAGLLDASAPLDVDWDFQIGAMHLAAPQEVEVSLVLDASAKPVLDGRAAPARAAAGATTHLKLTPGRHEIQGAVPPAGAIAQCRADLSAALQKARADRAQALAELRPPAEEAVTPLKASGTARLPSAVADIEVLGPEAHAALAVAEGKAIHLLGPDGRAIETLQADGTVRMLRWWAETGLLLAGCADEKVIAFDVGGASAGPGKTRRRWVFVSQMDPAVLRAAKTYWFKSAPGHEGIHGLYTGVFLDGKSQAFVGSACTLEILDAAGKLAHRMPLFWGKNSTFALVDAPDGTRNLLTARKYNGNNDVTIVNSKALRLAGRGFIAVPPGHTYVAGWSSMNRSHLFWEDLDGDGKREVVSEINGTWNRVCVWTTAGEPVCAASFGPGPSIPARTMLDVDVCDLDGDGRKEIVAATSSPVVVALDCRCRKAWAVRVPAAANVLACVRPKGAKRAVIVLGCDDGYVRLLDSGGKLIGKGPVAGRPVCIRRLHDAAGRPSVAVGTDRGEVAVFPVSP